MKKEVSIQLADYPENLHPFLENSKAYDTSSHSGAKVLYLDQGYYLKIDSKGSLHREAQRIKWFVKEDLGVPLIQYISTDKDYLLTKAADGLDATHFLQEPEKICQAMAKALRELHQLRPADFPTNHHLVHYRKVAQENYEKGYFYPKALLPQFGITSREEAYQLIQEKGHLLVENALIHGDACLPNIILKEDATFSSFIDVGLAGMSDRHIDIYWVIWSLHYNLGSAAYGDIFLDHYGRNQVDQEKLRLVAAFEAFG